jgi:competence protein ComEC
MQSNIVYIAIVSFAIGIAWQSIFKPGVAFAALLFIFIIVTAILLRKYREYTALVVIIILMFALGVVRTYYSQVGDIVQMSYLKDGLGKDVEVRGKIVSEPDKREYYTNLVILVLGTDTKVLVKTDVYGDYNYGDIVSASGKLESIENFISNSGIEFDYINYLAKDDIYYQVRRAEVSIVDKSGVGSINGLLFELKKRYLQSLASNIPEPESALAGGITVGAKSSMGKELLEQFRKTGVIHIVVLSGFNVAIVAIFFTYIFGFLGIRVGRALAVIGIILFAVLTGGGATVVRASAMGVLAILALTVRRKYMVLRALMIAAFAMLLYNPKILLYDISFQLSFVATLGMILGMPIILRYMSFMPSYLKMREIVSATIATQIFVAPLLLYYMGELSLVAILANALVLPMVTISMLMVFIAGVLGLVSSVLALPFASVSYWLLHSIIMIAQALSSAPYIILSVREFGILAVLVSYICIATVVLLYKSTGDDTPVYVV